MRICQGTWLLTSRAKSTPIAIVLTRFHRDADPDPSACPLCPDLCRHLGRSLYRAEVSPHFQVTVSSGELRSLSEGATVMPHRWTPEGVVVEAEFTGAHLFLLAAAGCVLNDLYREADVLDVEIAGVRVRAFGAFDPTSWVSTGVEYEVEVVSDSAPATIERLITTVDEVAEIPKALRAGTTVVRRQR